MNVFECFCYSFIFRKISDCRNTEKSSKRIGESKRPRRFPESSIYILTDLPGCVAHEVAICFVLPWLNVLRCSLGRQAGILRGLEEKARIPSPNIRFFQKSVASLFQDVSGFIWFSYIVSACLPLPRIPYFFNPHLRAEWSVKILRPIGRTFTRS